MRNMNFHYRCATHRNRPELASHFYGERSDPNEVQLEGCNRKSNQKLNTLNYEQIH